jgi:hypothetical protein
MGILDSVTDAASQVGGFFKGAGETLWETGEGLVDLGTGVVKTAYDASPAGLAVDAYEQATGQQAPDWLPSAERGSQRVENAFEVASTIARNPGLLVDAVVAPIKEDWNNGNYGEAIGRGVTELVMTVAGTKGVDKVAKGGRVAGAADDVADAARIADRVDTAGDVGRVTGNTSDELADILARAETGTSVGGRPLLRFESMDDFNVAANAARPNSVYEFGNYRWTTDDQARVIRAEGRVDLNPVGRNDPGLQTSIGHEGRPTDVGFHVIADRLGGPTNRLNVVPGNGKPIGDDLPNLNNGAYKRFENELARLADQGHQVDMRVMPEYNPGNTSNRPDRFVTEYRVDGGDWIDQTFINK